MPKERRRRIAVQWVLQRNAHASNKSQSDLRASLNFVGHVRRRLGEKRKGRRSRLWIWSKFLNRTQNLKYFLIFKISIFLLSQFVVTLRCAQLSWIGPIWRCDCSESALESLSTRQHIGANCGILTVPAKGGSGKSVSPGPTSKNNTSEWAAEELQFNPLWEKCSAVFFGDVTILQQTTETLIWEQDCELNRRGRPRGHVTYPRTFLDSNSHFLGKNEKENYCAASSFCGLQLISVNGKTWMLHRLDVDEGPWKYCILCCLSEVFSCDFVNP